MPGEQDIGHVEGGKPEQEIDECHPERCQRDPRVLRGIHSRRIGSPIGGIIFLIQYVCGSL